MMPGLSMTMEEVANRDRVLDEISRGACADFGVARNRNHPAQSAQRWLLVAMLSGIGMQTGASQETMSSRNDGWRSVWILFLAGGFASSPGPHCEIDSSDGEVDESSVDAHQTPTRLYAIGTRRVSESLLATTT